MGNAKSELGLAMVKVNLNDKDDVLGTLIDVISVDGDLSENEEYYREDTLALGFVSEAERLVEEATKGMCYDSIDKFKIVFDKVFSSLSDQEYFCVCDYTIEDLGDGVIMLAYAYGGNYSY
jgi:hypothetical protein